MTMLLPLRARLRTTVLRAPWVWYQHRGLRPNDLFLASYPKSGNTWLRFMVGQLLLEKELDFDSAKPMIPIVGVHHAAPSVLSNGGRVIKTHEPYRRDYRKAIYLVRDVRDVAVSYYYHQMRQGIFAGDLSSFVRRFQSGRVDGLSRWDRHVRSWLDSPLAREGALHVLPFEHLRADTAQALRGVADFIGIDASDELIANVVAANTLNRMQEKEATATVLEVRRTDIPVVRTGRSGEWKEVLGEAEKRIFLEQAGSELRRLGYEPQA